MFELKLKMDLSLSPCLRMIHSEPFSAPFSVNLSPDKCEQALEDRFDWLLLIVFFSLQTQKGKKYVFNWGSVKRPSLGHVIFLIIV